MIQQMLSMINLIHQQEFDVRSWNEFLVHCRCLLNSWGRVMHICVSKVTIIGSDNACHLAGAKPLSEPMLDIVNWTLGNKLQWNRNRDLYIFIQENAPEDVVWKMVTILSRPQFVKWMGHPTGSFANAAASLSQHRTLYCYNDMTLSWAI